MARINLLTIHWGNSYGGTMQTYATVKILQELGHEVKVINLKHPQTNPKNLYKKGFSPYRICKDIKFFLFKIFYIGHFTNTAYSIEECNIPESDFTIVGSDQVWNRDITNPIHEAYFLDFAKGCTKIAFSSSFGKYVWDGDENYTEFVRKELIDFKAIAVREESGVKICKEVFGVDATHVLDPTLVFLNYQGLVKKWSKPIHSIFPFLLKVTKDTQSICELVSKELSLPLFRKNRISGFLGMGPIEWLNRMKNSDFIITDSFHGLAFSLIFKKQFIVLCADEKKFARLKSLLVLTHLEDRYVKTIDDLQNRLAILKMPIAYNQVDMILEEERNKAVSFLKNNLASF